MQSISCLFLKTKLKNTYQLKYIPTCSYTDCSGDYVEKFYMKYNSLREERQSDVEIFLVDPIVLCGKYSDNILLSVT